MSGCFFCNVQKEKDKVFLENESFFIHRDNFPVSKGHCEIVMKKHVASFFDLDSGQLKDLYELIKTAKTVIDEEYNPDGYNIGVNEGVAAGRTIEHLHVHIIPRYGGDIINPRGGIRNIFPEKGDYTKVIK